MLAHMTRDFAHVVRGFYNEISVNYLGELNVIIMALRCEEKS
jgi:hypothetical protein